MLTQSFKGFLIKQGPRGENKKADSLSKIASTSFAHLSKQVLVEELKEKQINRKEMLAIMPLQENYVLREIYEGSCSVHTGPMSVVAKTIRIGYYWPTMHADARKLIRSLGEGIKARLDERSKDLMEELSHVLWAHRTMIRSSNRETSFLLTYKTEAVIPAEMGMRTLRTAKVDMVENDDALEINLDLL
ncbi:reverse transcriptase domain-containing protein [Tanacetum coccineum]